MAKKELLSKQIMVELFSITRTPSITDVGRSSQLAICVVKNNLDLESCVASIIEDDTTGWKEVVGKIAKLTGYGFQKLGLSKEKSNQLKEFGPVLKNECTLNNWNELLKKVQSEITTSKQVGAMINS